MLACLTLLLPELVLKAATVEYDLTIASQEMDFTGRPVEAMTINGQLPGPILRFTEGDRAAGFATTLWCCPRLNMTPGNTGKSV